MISKDGVHWSLFKKTWPIGGMYSTAAGLTFDEEVRHLRTGSFSLGEACLGAAPVTSTT